MPSGFGRQFGMAAQRYWLRVRRGLSRLGQIFPAKGLFTKCNPMTAGRLPLCYASFYVALSGSAKQSNRSTSLVDSYCILHKNRFMSLLRNRARAGYYNAQHRS